VTSISNIGLHKYLLKKKIGFYFFTTKSSLERIHLCYNVKTIGLYQKIHLAQIICHIENRF